MHAIVDQLYGWGFSCQYVTDRYASGFPSTWTVLPSAAVSIRLEDGRRAYKLGEDELDPARVIQIDRNPGTGLHGTAPSPPTRSRRMGCWRPATNPWR